MLSYLPSSCNSMSLCKAAMPGEYECLPDTKSSTLSQEKKMMEKLWGDNFFDPKTRKWTKRHTGSETCKRGFVQFVYDPIKTVVDACINEKRDKLYDMTNKLGFNLTSQQKELSGKALMKATLQSWIPAHEVPTPSPSHMGGITCS